MVKRVGNLMERIADRENLREAFLRAARGKSNRHAVVSFRNDLDAQLASIGADLLSGRYRFDDYHFFNIYDPKKRTICAAPFRHRVAFHALMRICHPVFDDYQIFDSYASRVGKGQYQALARAQHFSRRYPWFVKLDVQKYFDSIHHEVLFAQLCRLFKDDRLLTCFRNLIDSYEVSPRCGLPIGNLTSQYFANHYLSVADHYLKENAGVKGMVRYMDDVLLFADSLEQLKEFAAGYDAFCREGLRLRLHAPIYNKVCHGVPFLGYVVRSQRLVLNRRSRRRFLQKIGAVDARYWCGTDGERQLACKASCLFAFIHKADVRNFCHQAYHQGRYS